MARNGRQASGFRDFSGVGDGVGQNRGMREEDLTRDLTEERAGLERDGQVIVRGLLTPAEVARFRELVNAALPKAYKVQLPPGNEVYQAAFDQYMNLWQADAAMAELTLHPRLARTAAALLGVDAVRVYHDQALYKVAGGGHTPWHQDQWYWPLDTDRTITMWLPLHDIDPAMGDLEFALGTHGGPIGDEAISGESDAYYDRYLAETQPTMAPASNADPPEPCAPATPASTSAGRCTAPTRIEPTWIVR